MNILHYTGMPTSQKYGGLERWIVEFAKQANLLKHNTYVSYTQTFPLIKELIDDYNRMNLHLLVTLNKDCTLLLKQIKENNIDIVFFHFAEPYNEPLYIKKHTDCKVYCFFHCHNYYSNLKWHKNFKELLSASVYRARMFYSQFFIDGYIAVSKAVRKQFVSFCFINPYKVKQIYLGVSKMEIKYCFHKSNIPIIGCIACHGGYKGIDVLIEAASILKKEKYIFEIWQIGGGMSFNNGKDTEELIKLVEKKGLSKEFKFLGVRNDINTLLSQMDIYVQPSRREAISLTVAEAMMAKLPIVASNVDGIPEYIESSNNGFLYNNNNPIELAKYLQMLIENQNLRISMGERAYQFINQDLFNTVQNIRKLISLTLK